MICDKVFVVARGKCSLSYRYRSDGSISVDLHIARNRQDTEFETITIVAYDPSDLEPLFGHLPSHEED